MALKALDARLASTSPAPAPTAGASGSGPAIAVHEPSTSPTTATAPLPPSLTKGVSSKSIPQVGGEDKPEKVKD